MFLSRRGHGDINSSEQKHERPSLLCFGLFHDCESTTCESVIEITISTCNVTLGDQISQSSHRKKKREREFICSTQSPAVHGLQY